MVWRDNVGAAGKKWVVTGHKVANEVVAGITMLLALLQAFSSGQIQNCIEI